MDKDMFRSLSDAQLAEAKVKYSSLPSVMQLLEGIEMVREGERAKASEALEDLVKTEADKAEFEVQLANLVNLPEPPEGVYNVVCRWALVEVEDLEHGEEIEVVDENGEKATEFRSPKISARRWIVEVNKPTGSSSNRVGVDQDKKQGTSNAVAVWKVDSATPQLIGNFHSGADACRYLHILAGKDSANLALARNGYAPTAYEGNDFTEIP